MPTPVLKRNYSTYIITRSRPDPLLQKASNTLNGKESLEEATSGSAAITSQRLGLGKNPAIGASLNGIASQIGLINPLISNRSNLANVNLNKTSPDKSDVMEAAEEAATEIVGDILIEAAMHFTSPQMALLSPMLTAATNVLRENEETEAEYTPSIADRQLRLQHR